MLVNDGTQWSETADVVVVGLGAAGAVAAITAHDKGAKVVELEKQPAANHISTSSMSGGMIVSLNNVAAGVGYMERISRVDGELSWTDDATISVWAEYTAQNIQWLEKLGGRLELSRTGGEHSFPGTESVEVWRFAGRGNGMMRFLKHQVEERGVNVIYDAAADRVLTDARGRVVGVRALSHGNYSYVKASRGVVMCTGGFEFDEVMKLNFLKVYPAYFTASSASTGDGIRMAQEVGAALWHMNCCSANWVLKFPEMAIALGPNFGGSRGYSEWSRSLVEGNRCGFFIVDRYGRRYTSEEHKRHTLYYELALYDSQKLEHPRVPSYWIFDRTRFEAGPLPLMWHGPMQHALYRWSPNNKDELDRGYITSGDTIEKLADRLDMDSAVLAKTWKDYNTYCERHEDPDFHCPPQYLVALAEPPFFAVKLWPGGPNTQGGARRNHRAQVINANNEPIPGFYAAGEFGSLYGMLYPAGGGNLAECIAFGRIAGENAAKG